jgi:molecular chaperone DnaK (HSP70)
MLIIFDQGWQRLPHGKQAKDGICNYFAEVYNFYIQSLERKQSKELLTIASLECWITMPAIWFDTAQSATRDAAMKAGFSLRTYDEVYITTEHEAAALAVP